MLLLVLKFTGWLVAHTPEPLLRAFAIGLGDSIFFCLPRRRRLILSNLHHAFPERPPEWHRRIGRESCRRLIETALLSLATPSLSAERYRRIIAGSESLRTAYAKHNAKPTPTLICSPHVAYWEAQTAMALVIPTPFPEFGTIYRPLDNAAADEFVKASRERYGMRLLSRKEGFAEALKILRRRGLVGVLFDQNAGMQGALTTLFGRVCSTSELPGLMAEKFEADVYGIYSIRHGFWRVEICVDRIASDGTSTGVTLALNRWLEGLLQRDDNLCASWLWAHDRWRNQDLPSRRLRLEAKRNLLGADRAARQLTSLPRRTRIWIRLPNWLGDVVMALPLLRALRMSRPDAELTVVARPQFIPLLEKFGVAERYVGLPPKGSGYFAAFRRLRAEYPDTWILFTNSTRGDLEAWLTQARQRFGIGRAGKMRPLLSHRFDVPPGFDESAHHQFELWENFLRHFGLQGEIDRSAFPWPESSISSGNPIGLIAGSENTPEKRWPVDHWRGLIASLPEERFILFGTANDIPVTTAIAAGFDPARVENAAGRTDLLTFAGRLKRCRLLVTNDTGGMHLANALGVPLVVLFGPTNPIRTGPIFRSDSSAATRILQPAGCPPTGGRPLAELAPATVLAAVREALAAPLARV